MAFFKFRFPGQAASASVDAVPSGPSQNIDIVRRRARHRLMGAVVLVLVAVVGFPLLFDTQPRPVAVDTPIVIPDRQTASPLTSPQAVPAPQAPAKPLLAASGAVPAQASLDPREEVVLPVPEPAAVMSPSAKALAPKTAAAPETSVEKAKDTSPKPEVKAAAPAKSEKPVAPATPAKPKDDGSKAHALLEGKPAKAVPERVVIQVGAFSDADKVHEVRRKLEQSGFKTYTQVVDGKEGKKTTRVRVGPFDNRDEAEKAAARIRKLDFAPSILKI
ncbi:SPOR domain-containing protein [Limnohabitans sp. T6-5]|uniref:SPOR domain-containing protein n=1 Tax=Limnohabitans sp. T6-5 TaxID=1100724 RepID=UPI000D37B87A|nr:SPOR domain-containing protein [Limnohabitans sp. T6-5]PUE11191.1 SPOR domain-containing protein [Limnohabitans sp. T6-5]